MAGAASRTAGRPRGAVDLSRRRHVGRLWRWLGELEHRGQKSHANRAEFPAAAAVGLQANGAEFPVAASGEFQATTLRHPPRAISKR